MDPMDSDERPPRAQRLGVGARWFIKQLVV